MRLVFIVTFVCLCGCNDASFNSKGAVSNRDSQNPNDNVQHDETAEKTAVGGSSNDFLNPNDSDGSGSIHDTWTIDGNEVTIRRACTVVIAWNNRNGPDYVPEIPELPKSVTIKKLDLYKNKIKKDDLLSVDLFIMSDGPVVPIGGDNYEKLGYRDFEADEKSLFQDSFAKTAFIMSTDNGDWVGHGDAGRGSRVLLSSITDKMALDPLCTSDSCYEREDLFPADAAKYPFLKGVGFDFRGEGMASPAYITKVAAPAECILSPSGKCRIGWLPDTADHSFIFVNGNAGTGGKLFFSRLIEKKCQ